MQNFGQMMPRECGIVSIHRHSGAMRSIEPGISRFRVWSFGPSRNDSGYVIASVAKQFICRVKKEKREWIASLALAMTGKPLTHPPPRD
jgi:hypothetical protein